jgi:hypothetical protein
MHGRDGGLFGICRRWHAREKIPAKTMKKKEERKIVAEIMHKEEGTI